MLKYQPDATFRAQLEKRLQEPSINDGLYSFLEHHGAAIPATLKNRDRLLPTAPNEQVEDEIYRLYKNRRDMRPGTGIECGHHQSTEYSRIAGFSFVGLRWT